MGSLGHGFVTDAIIALDSSILHKITLELQGNNIKNLKLLEYQKMYMTNIQSARQEMMPVS